MASSRCFRVLLALAVLSVTVPAQTHPSAPRSGRVPTQLPGQDSILVGTAWYPEQWPEARWEEDLALMQAANIKVVRIAEFAWSTLEPSEGHYEFNWLDRAIALAAKHHIVSVLGTPTAAPPAWLTQKYPDTLRVESEGKRATHGNRAHGSVSSPRYREFCRKIAEQMASRYGRNPNVVGWQIDNEYGYALMSYDDHARKLFQDWVEAKYKTVDNLNQQWTTAYWSETYDAWTEIPIPVGPHNPGLMLDWKRFVSATWNDYQKNQIAAIREHAEPRQFITGNLMGFFDGFDHYLLSEPLTFASWDDYVGTGHVDPDSNGLAHDLTRGFKRDNFWVMETQPGAVNWAPVNNFLNRGEARAMAWQAIAHGADEVGYWQWRSALNGQEQYHGTLVGADGAPVPFYQEAKQTAQDFATAQAAFRDTRVVSEVALLHAYDSRWAIDFQKHNQNYDQIAILKSYYRSLRRLAQSIDVLSPDAPLGDYKLVVAPDLNLIPEDLAQHLLEYVKSGGHLILGPRSGMKDQFNSLLPQRQPGYLTEALGGRVDQYYALEKDVSVTGEWGDGQVTTWAEQMTALSPGAQVLMRYGKSNGWLDDQPAVLSRTYGKGRITYTGAVLDDKLMASAAAWMVKISGVAPVFGAVPDGVEVSRRSSGRQQVFVLINFTSQPQHIALPRPMNTLLQPVTNNAVELAPYGVEVLTESSGPTAHQRSK